MTQAKHEIEWEGFYEQFNQQHPVKFQNMTITADGSIQGQGSDDVGGFNISGKISEDGSVKFEKAYHGKHAVNYAGTLNSGKIIGEWSVQGSKGGFEVHMKTKQWKGENIISAPAGGQSPGGAKPTPVVISLDFDPHGIKICGIGSDEKGNFNIRGVCPEEFNRSVISLEKIYFDKKHEKHFMSGVLTKENGQELILGNWIIPGKESGSFRLVKQN